MSIASEAETMKRNLEAELKTKVRIALFGQPGAGKSSIINGLVGRPVAEVDARTDTTVAAASYDFAAGVLTDLPGYGTERFPAATYIDRFNISDFDLFLCVTSGKLTASDSSLAAELRRMGKVCIVVFNKVDTVWQAGKTLDELKKTLATERRSELGDSAASVIFTSCKDQTGFSELIEAIYRGVEPSKAERWARSAKAYSQDFLNRKRDACDSLGTHYAIAAAANALNPIPGVDVAVDAGLLMKAFADVRDAYGLTDKKLSAIGTVAPALEPLASRIVEQGTKAGLLALLKSLVKRTTARRLAKYIPIVGQAVAAATSYGFTSKAVEAYVDECHELASAILKHELEMKKGVPS